MKGQVRLRHYECLRLRVRDLDLGAKQIIVRNGKGAKDRVAASTLNKALSGVTAAFSVSSFRFSVNHRFEI